MAGLVRVVVGLMLAWTLFAIAETAGIPILPRTAVSLPMAPR